MGPTDLLPRLGNTLYKRAFPLYKPLYSAFKAYMDRAERHLISNFVSVGDVVVDGGANIGIYSRFFSRCVGSSGLVHSFEPAPDNFARLKSTVASLPNVQPNQVAISDATGEQLLYISDSLNVDHRSYLPGGGRRRALSVRSIRIDDYFSPHERVDFIKLDIQGYELHALRGARRVMTDNPQLNLLLEFWPYGLRQAGSSANALLVYLRQSNFTVFSFEDGKEVFADAIFPDDNKTRYFNLFATRTS